MHSTTRGAQHHTIRAVAVVIAAVAAAIALGVGPNRATAGGVEPPGPPRSVRAEADGAEIEVSWRRPADGGGATIRSYVVQFRRTSSPVWRRVIINERGTTLEGLRRGAYLVRVAAVNREGRGPWSSITDVSTARPPAPAPTPTPAPTPAPNCDPSYPTVCIPPPPPDLDCGEIGYRNFTVVGSDPHGFDGDSDGVGCES